MVGIAIVLIIVIFLVRRTRDMVRRKAIPTSRVLVVFGFVADWRR
jgi:glucan phosphoethanolaminetransferase (alkaline phosphatase superfamily)